LPRRDKLTGGRQTPFLPADAFLTSRRLGIAKPGLQREDGQLGAILNLEFEKEAVHVLTDRGG
jgi:hypothetical protein